MKKGQKVVKKGKDFYSWVINFAIFLQSQKTRTNKVCPFDC